MEMEEEEIVELSFHQVEELVDESARHLRKQLGVVLPRIGRAPKRSADHRVCDPLGVPLPAGGLFYPSCGADLDDAAESFGPSVTELHFADPCNPPQPRLRPKKDAVAVVTIPHIESVVLREPAHATEDRGTHSAHIHAKDGLLTLIDDVRALAVFYYRGDSYGEGGSNQRWLEPVLFHTVLARLLDGGLIVTDGSNCGSGKPGIRVPWSALCGESSENTSFEYADRRFVFLGSMPGRRERVVRAWQVTAHV